MNGEQIAIKEKINELRAKQRKFSCQEEQKAKEIQFLIIAGSAIEDEIIALELKLSRLKEGALS